MPNINNIPTTQYVGPKIVPHLWNPIIWDSTTQYDALAVVQYNGNGYISRYIPPVGTAPTDDEYWVKWADFNAQLANLQQTVDTFDGRIDSVENDVDSFGKLIPSSSFSSSNTVKDYIDGVNESLDDEVSARTSEVNRIDGELSHKIEVSAYVDETYDYTEHSSHFMLDENRAGNGLIQSVSYENGSYKTNFNPSEYNFSGGSNIDVCWSITLLNSYLQHINDFYYGNNGVGVQYVGSFDNPTRCNPHNYIVDGKMPIDCNTLTQLVGHGVVYDMSPYSTSGIRAQNIGCHPMFNPVSDVVKQYWSYNGIHDGHTDDEMGYGRMLSDGFAKYLYDSGKLEFMNNGISESLVPGKIYFCGNDSSRFLGITHCFMVGGIIGNSYRDKIIVESLNVNNPLVSRGYANVNYNTVAAYTPNFSCGVFMNILGGNAARYDNVNLSANPVSIPNSQNNICCRVFTICANTSSMNANLTLTNDVTGEIMTKSLSVGKTSHVMFIPYGWSLQVASSSSTPVNIVYQYCFSDTDIEKARI